MSDILIAEDDISISQMVCEAFQKEGIRCTQAFSGTEALLWLRQKSFDLVLLDLMLPGKPGEEVLKEIRKAKTLPVIIISAKDALDHKVALLLNGADDYLTKPFELKELVARAKVQLRRAAATGKKELCYKKLVLNREQHRASLERSELNLTRQEFRIIELLMENPERVFSKQEIYEYAWEDYFAGEDKTLNVHISNIRSKLKAVTEEPYIETVWGIGFKLAK